MAKTWNYLLGCCFFYFLPLLTLLFFAAYSELNCFFSLCSSFFVCLTHCSLLMSHSFSHLFLCCEWWCWLSEEAVLQSLSVPLCLYVCCLIKHNKRDCDAQQHCVANTPPTSAFLFLQPPPSITIAPHFPSGTGRMLNLHLLQTNPAPSFQYSPLHPHE